MMQDDLVAEELQAKIRHCIRISISLIRRGRGEDCEHRYLRVRKSMTSLMWYCASCYGYVIVNPQLLQQQLGLVTLNDD